MRKKLTYTLLISASLLSSCLTTNNFLLISEGEQFDALTKITDSEKPSIYPTGGDYNKNLIFSAMENDKSYNIYLKDNVLTKAVIQKTTGKNFNLAPSFCDKNNQIAFQYLDKTNFDIYYIDATKGKSISQVTNTEENEYNPNWSPDGTNLIFEKGNPPKYFIEISSSAVTATRYTLLKVTQNQLWIKNMKTGELKMIGEGSFPSISPDGNTIAFVKYDLNKSKSKEIGTIWTMELNGENPSQITDATLGYASQPKWSPDGEKIVFHLTKTNKLDADIYSIDKDGDNLKQYTTNKSNDFSPYWSKDNFIYFSSERGSKSGNYQIWRFKL